jgi:hypothetical protein
MSKLLPALDYNPEELNLLVSLRMLARNSSKQTRFFFFSHYNNECNLLQYPIFKYL